MLKVVEGTDVPATLSADEGEHPGSVVGVSAVKHRHALGAVEADFFECADDLVQVGGRKPWGWPGRERAQVEQGASYPAFEASPSQKAQGGLAGREVEIAFRADADELAGTDDLQFS